MSSLLASRLSFLSCRSISWLILRCSRCSSVMQHAIMEAADEGDCGRRRKRVERGTTGSARCEADRRRSADQPRGREVGLLRRRTAALPGDPGVATATRATGSASSKVNPNDDSDDSPPSLPGVWPMWQGGRDGLRAALAGGAGWRCRRLRRLRGRVGTAKGDVSGPSWNLSSAAGSSSALTTSSGLRSTPRGLPRHRP